MFKFCIFLGLLACLNANADDAGRVDYICEYGYDAVTYTNVWVDPSRVYWQFQEKEDHDGNSYKIEWLVMTNQNTHIPPGEDLTNDYYQAYLSTATFPTRRVNVELSTDGGSNFTKRISFGAQHQADRRRGEIMWSPAPDQSIITEHAVIRLTDLDGMAFDNGPTNYPFNLRPGEFVQSYSFAIRAVFIIDPAPYTIVYSGGTMSVNFLQTGGGSVWDIGWFTEEDNHFHPMVTVSNVVGGVINTGSGICTIPPAPRVRLMLWSHDDRCLKGYSGIFAVE